MQILLFLVLNVEKDRVVLNNDKQAFNKTETLLHIANLCKSMFN